MRNLHAAHYGRDDRKNKEDRALCVNSERKPGVVLWVLFAEKSYSAVREERFLESMAWRLEAVPDCFVACCQANDRICRVSKQIRSERGGGRELYPAEDEP